MTIEEKKIRRKAYMKVYRKAHLAEKRAWSKQDRLKNGEHYRAYHRKWEKQHPRGPRPEHAAYLKEYVQKHYSEIRRKAREFYWKNRERLLEWKREHQPTTPRKLQTNREWCRKHPGHVRARVIKRKLGMVTPESELKLVNDFILRIRSMPRVHCNYCGTVLPGKEMDIDHIVPVSRGGKHELFNLCASCPTCNNRKYNKLPSEWKREGQLFLL